MRSDAVDRLVSAYLKRPVLVSWEGSLADPLTGCLDQARIAFGGVATGWMSLDEVVIAAERVELSPGMPSTMLIRGARVEVALAQPQLDDWLERFRLPFELLLEERGLVLRAGVPGVPKVDFETGLSVVRGWFVLQPRRTAFVDVPPWVGTMLRAYLPLPPISESARIGAIRHEPGRVRVEFEVDDLEEELNAGLVGRLRERLLPFWR